MKAWFLALFLWTVGACAASAAIPSPAAWQGLLEDQITAARAHGGAAAVVTAEGVRWVGVHGLADAEAGRPVDRDTLFQIASATKNMTAMLLMSLVEDGTLRLDDPVSRHLALEAPIGDLTLRQLASHSAGLRRQPSNRVAIDGVIQPYSTAQLLQALEAANATGLSFPPGTDVAYSNVGYLLLGHVLEQAAEKPFEALLADRVFTPLELTDTAVTIAPEDEPRLAVHYWAEDDPRQPRPRWVFGEGSAAAGVTSTIDDLARYLVFVTGAGEGPVSSASLAQQREPQVWSSDGTFAFGIGWSIWRDDDGVLVMTHDGRLPGVSSFIGYAPDAGVAVAVLVNLGDETAPQIGEALLLAAARERRASVGGLSPTTPR